MPFTLKQSDLQLIDAAQICENHDFDWIPEEPSAFLEHSLQEHGILEALIVVSVASKQFQIIDGFKRIAVLKKHESSFKNQKIPCVILPSDFSAVNLGELRLSSLKLASLKGMGVCRILHHLKQLGFLEQRLATEILPEMQLKASLHRVKQLLNLASQLKTHEFPSSLNHLNVEDLLPLLRFPKQDWSFLIQLSTYFSVGGKKWKILLQLLREVLRLKECSLEELMETSEIQEILQNSQLQSPVRYRLLKDQLEHWRYPEWSWMRDQFARQHQKIKVPHGVQIHGDLTFEQEELRFCFKSHSLDHLKSQWKELWKEEQEQKLEQLFQAQQAQVLDK